MMQFHIQQWRAWAPGIDSGAAWKSWAQAPISLADNNEQPACEFLAPMQRRRLSRLARITLDTAWPLCDEGEQLPFVFASRHGETTRTFALLADIAAERPLSPTQFGLSVHNAIAGQWSILRRQTGESVAIAGESDTFEHAMLEAALLLNDGAKSVLVVIAEEMPPAPYQPWIDDVPFSYALALRLGKAENAASGTWNLQREGHESTAEKRNDWPNALNFLRALNGQMDRVEHVCKTRRWIWQLAR